MAGEWTDNRGVRFQLKADGTDMLYEAPKHISGGYIIPNTVTEIGDMAFLIAVG